jgi:hypothetical protein
MQRALLAVIDARLRRSCGSPHELVRMLVEAYDSPHTQEPMAGLRATIAASHGLDLRERVQAVLEFLGAMPAAFDVIDGRARILN